MKGEVVQFPGRPPPQEVKRISRIQSAAALASVPDYPSVHRWHADPEKDEKRERWQNIRFFCITLFLFGGLILAYGVLLWLVILRALPLLKLLLHH